MQNHCGVYAPYPHPTPTPTNFQAPWSQSAPLGQLGIEQL